MDKRASLIVGVVALMLMVAVVPAGYAADSDVVLSEVMFNSACEAPNSAGVCGSGTDETQFEWVEIFNKGNTTVDLSGWQICDETNACNSLSGTINPGKYLVIAHNNDAPNNDLQVEFSNYGATVVSGSTIFLNAPIGNGLTNAGDAVYLRTDVSTCGLGGNLPCVSDCVSWDSTNTCVSLIDNVNRAFLAGSDGFDSTALTSNEQDGQSIVNISGTWFQSGPSNNTANQASPYSSNTKEGGPTEITLSSLTAYSDHPSAKLQRVPRDPFRRPTAGLAGLAFMLAAAGLTIRKRRRPH